MTSLRNWINYTLSFEAMGPLVATSYKDFRVKGLNYLCLHRSPSHTVKIYLFDGEIRALIPADAIAARDAMIAAERETEKGSE